MHGLVGIPGNSASPYPGHDRGFCGRGQSCPQRQPFYCTGTARLGGNGANLAVPLLIPDGLGSWPASACTATDGSLGTSPNIGAALC